MPFRRLRQDVFPPPDARSPHGRAHRAPRPPLPEERVRLRHVAQEQPKEARVHPPQAVHARGTVHIHQLSNSPTNHGFILFRVARMLDRKGRQARQGRSRRAGSIPGGESRYRGKRGLRRRRRYLVCRVGRGWMQARNQSSTIDFPQTCTSNFKMY